MTSLFHPLSAQMMLNNATLPELLCMPFDELLAQFPFIPEKVLVRCMHSLYTLAHRA